MTLAPSPADTVTPDDAFDVNDWTHLICPACTPRPDMVTLCGHYVGDGDSGELTPHTCPRCQRATPQHLVCVLKRRLGL